MGLLSNSISRDELKAGDHIYSWRTAYVYAHHGIYVGENKVIHFTSGRGEICSSSSFPSPVPCPTCSTQQEEGRNGVVSSCLDCFLAGGNLYRFEYSVSTAMFFAKARGGACTFADSDPHEIVVRRATYLLNKGFGCYDIFKSNCEDFALYCKTGLLHVDQVTISGQADSLAGGVAAMLVSISWRLASTTTGVYGMAVNAFGIYCASRYRGDIGKRKDVVKVEAEDLHKKLFDGANEVPAIWTSEQECYFIDLMLQKIKAKGGNRRFDTFSKEEWLDLRVNFYNHFQKKYGLEHFVTKVIHLEEKYDVFKKLVEDSTTTGLGWDPMLKTVNASDEWWRNYLKTNPNARRFRHQGCTEYEQLRVIFGDTVETGILQALSDHNFNSTDRENNEDEKLVKSVPSSTPLEGESSTPSTGVDGEGRIMQVMPSTPQIMMIPTPQMGEIMVKADHDFNSTNEENNKHEEHKDKYTLSKCMDILDAFDSELCDTTYARALKLLQENGWREAFLRMTNERRKGWLRSIESGNI